MRPRLVAVFIVLCVVLDTTGARIKRRSSQIQAHTNAKKNRIAQDVHGPRVWQAVKPGGVEDIGVPMCKEKSLESAVPDVVLPWGRSIEGEIDGEWLKVKRFTVALYLPMSNLKMMRGQTWQHAGTMPVKIFKEPNLMSKNVIKNAVIRPGQPISVLGETTENGMRFLKLADDQWVAQHDTVSAGSAAHFYRTDVLEDTIIDSTRKEITVVGCGIAGIVTALELDQRDEVGRITIMDREATCAAGTSGRIAAELMFYNFERDFFNKGEHTWNMNWQKIWQAQGSAHQGAWFKMYELYKKHKAAKGTRVKLACGAACLASLSFKWSPWGSAMLSDVGNSTLGVKPGDVLVSVAGKSAHEVWLSVESWETIEEGMEGVRDQQVNHYVRNVLLGAAKKKTISLEFQRGGDPRITEPYMAAFFARAAENMKRLLGAYPALCEAIITPFCCDLHPAYIEEHAEAWGYDCKAHMSVGNHGHGLDPGMGMAEVFMTEDTKKNAEDKGWVDNPTSFEVWTEQEVQDRLPTFIDEDKQYGAAVNRVRAGFVRTEDLGRVFSEIMIAKGHKIMLQTELIGTIQSDSGQLVVEYARVNHDWELGDDKVLRLAGVSYESGSNGWLATHGAVICTGATSRAVAKMDKDIWNELIPGFGNIVVGPPGQVPQKERRMGVVLEEFHMYLRSSKDGRLAVGGGLWCSWGNDNMVRALPYKEKIDYHGEFWGTTGDKYMKQSKLGTKLVENPETVRKGGARPLSYFGNFPLIKMHPWAPVVFNSGGGVNGFSISWGSGSVAADLILRRQVLPSTGIMWHHAWSYMNAATPNEYIPYTEWEVIADVGITVYKEKHTKHPLDHYDKGGLLYGYVEGDGWFAAKAPNGAVAYVPMFDKTTGAAALKPLD